MPSRSQNLPGASASESMKAMPGVSLLLNRIIDASLHATIFFIPLFFCGLTLDALELSKQTVLIFLAVIAGVAWLGKALTEKQISLVRDWIHLVAVLFGIGYLLVSFLSQDRYMSFVGSAGQMPWAFSTIASLIVLYVVAVNQVRTTSQVYNYVFSFLLSSLFAGVYGLLQMFGIYLFPSSVSHLPTFTSIGSVFSFAVYMTVPITIAASLVFHGCRNNVCLLGSSGSMGLAARVLLWVTLVVGVIDLVIVDYWVAWIALLFGTILTVGAGYWRSRKIAPPTKLAIPLVLAAISLLLLAFHSPINLNLPSEVSPSAMASMDIAKAVMRDMPVAGSGPGTWINDYAKYHAQAVNASPFWNVRFDRGFSYFLTLLSTTGIIGALLWLMLIISGMVKGAGLLMREKNEDLWYAYLIVFVGWLTLVFTSFFYNYNVAHVVALWFLFGLLGAMIGRNSYTMDARKNAYSYGVLSVIFVIAVLGGASALWLTGERYAADIVFAGAVNDFHTQKPVDDVITGIQRAHTLNPMYDMYMRNLSQAHLIKAAGLIQSRPEADQVPTIQAEIKAAIDLGLAATSLHPANVDNWSNLGLIYQSVASFTRGADEFAIKNFQEASVREPQNPVFLNEIGKMYLLRSDAYRTQLGTGDAAAKAETQKQMNDNLALAEQTLKSAIAAKADYLPARYHLGIVYERQGRVKDAISELENVLRINNQDLGVAFELSILYYRNNQKAEALELMQQVVKLDGKNANARWYLSAMLEEKGAYQEALDQVKPLITQYPGNTTIQQRINSLQASVNSHSKPSDKPLPEPIREDVRSQSGGNALQNP